MNALRSLAAATLCVWLVACGTPPRPASFAGVHGLAVEAEWRLPAGTVVGNTIRVMDRAIGKAEALVGGTERQTDDVAVGPKGDVAWIAGGLTGPVQRVVGRHGTLYVTEAAGDLVRIDILTSVAVGVGCSVHFAADRNTASSRVLA
jgi:hypothetical protein